MSGHFTWHLRNSIVLAFSSSMDSVCSLHFEYEDEEEYEDDWLPSSLAIHSNPTIGCATLRAG